MSFFIRFKKKLFLFQLFSIYIKNLTTRNLNFSNKFYTRFKDDNYAIKKVKVLIFIGDKKTVKRKNFMN